MKKIDNEFQGIAFDSVKCIESSFQLAELQHDFNGIKTAIAALISVELCDHKKSILRLLDNKILAIELKIKKMERI